jgi:hypothetical protein
MLRNLKDDSMEKQEVVIAVDNSKVRSQKENECKADSCRYIEG